MGHVFAGMEITYDLRQRSTGRLDRASDAEEGTQLIDVKRRQVYQKTYLFSQTLTSAVDGSDDGDVDDRAKDDVCKTK